MQHDSYIAKIISLTADHFGIVLEDQDELSRNERFLSAVMEKDPEWHHFLSDTLNTWTMYTFIKKDKELKIKMPDVWESEVRRLRDEYETAREKMEGFLGKQDI